mmetsp:Transcript_82858/g.164429  ORF Transcript_82858/g.164429 Transcript_82858/m.164429 type:complete len:276 (+) Transcript_82858:528-1355(+)
MRAASRVKALMCQEASTCRGGGFNSRATGSEHVARSTEPSRRSPTATTCPPGSKPARRARPDTAAMPPQEIRRPRGRSWKTTLQRLISRSTSCATAKWSSMAFRKASVTFTSTLSSDTLQFTGCAHRANLSFATATVLSRPSTLTTHLEVSSSQATIEPAKPSNDFCFIFRNRTRAPGCQALSSSVVKFRWSLGHFTASVPAAKSRTVKEPCAWTCFAALKSALMLPSMAACTPLLPSVSSRSAWPMQRESCATRQHLRSTRSRKPAGKKTCTAA